MTKASVLKKLVGWDVGTIGYHGDDGHLYVGTGKGQSFGPPYTTGDVIGCGLNFVRGLVFFTRNGVYVGDRSYPLAASKEGLYAAFGMKSPGEAGEANFGFTPFAFDLEAYIEKERARFRASLDVQYGEDRLLTEPTRQLLVLRHLIHAGCEEAAVAFFNSALGPFEAVVKLGMTEKSIRQSLGKAKRRKELARSLLQGHIEELLGTLEAEYAGLVDLDTCPNEISYALTIDLFCQLVLRLPTAQAGHGLERLLQVGRILETHEARFSKTRGRISRDALALIAYKEPLASPSAYLYGEAHRQELASQLEDALLLHDGLSSVSPLERLLQALQTNLEALKSIGVVPVAVTEAIPAIALRTTPKAD